MKVPRDFDIFSPLTLSQPWTNTEVGIRKPERVEHRRPEQAVEVGDVLADEVVELGGRVLAPVGVEVEPRASLQSVLKLAM